MAADAYFPVTGPECTVLERATVEQMRERLVAAGLATDDEIDRHLAAIDAGGMDFATSPMISAWGRRPRPGGDAGRAGPVRGRRRPVPGYPSVPRWSPATAR